MLKGIPEFKVLLYSRYDAFRKVPPARFKLATFPLRQGRSVRLSYGGMSYCPTCSRRWGSFYASPRKH